MNQTRTKVDRILLYTLLPAVFISLYLVFIWSPIEKQMGVTQKIFYFHVGCAWVAFLAFFIVGFYSVLTLKKPTENRFIQAGISAELGVLFTTITLITGMIWGKSSWNTWWTWEPRLVTTLILWFIYVAYLFVRKMEGSWEKIARFSAVFGIIGCINVPIVFMAIRWWNTKLHPIVFGEGKNQQGGGIEPNMLITLLFCIATITLLYVFLMRKGTEIEKMRLAVTKAKNKAINKLAS
ncbi:cytochrome c biogenesis protein CcsA [Cytobacillus spongiae]|jgi:heme exporter protein C|uniref:cytochrome c biogenesis protein n=1 Tax=Cytobacillus spongiae TaxID=2901381 RepID=UPI001F45841B|nr:cytochrome c biogenesis protein CcsA [Cytobacillus spongiae]UII55271.1 cytochrome c biogenesis protein CcsA [Cytobacillus spongiae]